MTGDTILAALEVGGLKRVGADSGMSKFTSWRIGGPADYICVAETERHLLEAITVAKSNGLPWLVLGGGNNILVADEGIEGIVILNRIRGTALERDEEGPLLACGAGVFFARAAQYSASRGYSGMEWGIAIPGTVGAGVVNNAGAHASDVSRALVRAHVMTSDGAIEQMKSTDLEYRYRQSLLKSSLTTQTQLVVTQCRFRLTPVDPRAALGRIDDLRRHRLRTQPVKEASAGSTFKNPDGLHAGALVDRAGLKGRRIGDAQIAPLHANFILNLGLASASDVLALIQLARHEVYRQFNTVLEPEIQFVGRWDTDELESLAGIPT